MTASPLAELLRHRAVTDAARVAYAFGDERLTYGELLRDAGRIAEKLDAGPGDRVAIVLPAGLDFVKAFWAVQLTGAASAAMNPHVPEETTRKRIAQIQPRAVISPEAISALPSPRSALPLAFLQPTSGTSGEPRAAMITHANVAAVQEAAAEALGFSAADVLVAWVPPWHDLGLVRFVIGAVWLGAPCHIVTPSVRTIPQWLATIAAVRGTVTGAPDFAFRIAARESGGGALDLSSLRCVTNGGEPVRRTTIGAFEERFRLPGIVRPGYGLAEATLGVTTLRPGEPLRVDERGHVSCGRPLPGVEVRIGDDGEILVRGPGVFAGYFDAPEATAETLRDGWLHTGDVGYVDDDGHLYVLGRRRAMLKRGGAALAPRELEELAHEVDGVRIAAAVSLPGDLSERITVAVEAEHDVSAAVAHTIRAALGFTPRVVVLPPRTIPRTHNGKIRHEALRAMLRERAGQ